MNGKRPVNFTGRLFFLCLCLHHTAQLHANFHFKRSTVDGKMQRLDWLWYVCIYPIPIPIPTFNHVCAQHANDKPSL